MSEKQRITIDELQAMLQSDDDYDVTIHPDGTVTSVLRPKSKIADILEFARKEPTNY